MTQTTVILITAISSTTVGITGKIIYDWIKNNNNAEIKVILDAIKNIQDDLKTVLKEYISKDDFDSLNDKVNKLAVDLARTDTKCDFITAQTTEIFKRLNNKG